MVFLNVIKVNGTYTVDLAIEWPIRDVVYKHFAFVCFVFRGAAPLHVLYVQAAILNLPHP